MVKALLILACWTKSRAMPILRSSDAAASATRPHACWKVMGLAGH
jgi:hypothetical protein